MMARAVAGCRESLTELTKLTVIPYTRLRARVLLYTFLPNFNTPFLVGRSF